LTPEQLERRRASRRAYNERNRAEVLAKKRAKTAEARNPEAARLYAAEYRAQHKDELNEKLKAWRKLNPEKVRDYGRKRRAAKLNAPSEPYTATAVLNVHGSNCHLCGMAVDLTAPRTVGRPGWERGLHLDHVRPISRGGSDMMDNIRPAHALCNLKKHASVED